MAKDESPSVETLYVGQAMAAETLQALAISLASHLGDVNAALATAAELGQPPPDYRALVAQLIDTALARAAIDTDVTDLPAGRFDADAAKAVALDQIGRAVELIRMAL